MTPCFTVVTVCFNAGKALRPTVESVLSQTCGDFECLIKDGGSTDGSLDDLPSDPRLRIIRAPDGGIFDAMNQAIDAAQGRFIHFLNAGDFYVSDKVLGVVASEIERLPAAEFFYADVLCPGFIRQHVRYPDRLTRYFLFTQMLCHQGWFVARDTYLQMGKFKLCAKIGSDQVFLYDAILGAQVSYRHVPRFAVRYDVHGVSSNSAVQSQSKAFREMARRAYYPAWEGMLYKTIWGLRSFVRWCVSLPPFLKIFRLFQAWRWRNVR